MHERKIRSDDKKISQVDRNTWLTDSESQTNILIKIHCIYIQFRTEKSSIIYKKTYKN